MNRVLAIVSVVAAVGVGLAAIFFVTSWQEQQEVRDRALIAASKNSFNVMCDPQIWWLYRTDSEAGSLSYPLPLAIDTWMKTTHAFSEVPLINDTTPLMIFDQNMVYGQLSSPTAEQFRKGSELLAAYCKAFEENHYQNFYQI